MHYIFVRFMNIFCSILRLDINSVKLVSTQKKQKLNNCSNKYSKICLRRFSRGQLSRAS